MQYSLSHLSDNTLLQGLASLIERDRANTAELLAHLAEVDERKLYLPAGYPSMFVFCVQSLRLSEDSAFKRIRAARAARRFPGLLTAISEGRLTLSAVVLLAPHLTTNNADQWIVSATHKCKAELEQLIAERSRRPDVPARVSPLSIAAVGAHCSGSSGATELFDRGHESRQLAPGPVVPAVRPMEPRGLPPKVTPLAPQRFAVQFTMDQGTQGKLRYAQELLGHQVPAKDLAQIFDRALDVLIAQLEKRKFASTDRPRPEQATNSARHVPAHVKRAVWERDQGRCTFVSATGHRCPERTRVEYDHVDPVARGGQATISGIRLRCRAHNQFEAERTFGIEFMRQKRAAARAAALS